MKGYVDHAGRALVFVSLLPAPGKLGRDIQAWIDTGFTGDLALPQTQIKELNLPQSGTVRAILADGSETILRTYECVIDWFGTRRTLEIVANDGDFPLLGVGLLTGHDLFISYRSGSLSVE